MVRNVAVKIPETESGPRILEKLLSVSVLELLVTLARCIMFGKNI